MLDAFACAAIAVLKHHIEFAHSSTEIRNRKRAVKKGGVRNLAQLDL